jgi:hypothetical protein
LASAGVHQPVEFFDFTGVLADEERGEVADYAFDAGRGAVGVGYFGPADYVVYGGHDFDE